MSNYGLHISVLCKQVGTPTFIGISVQPYHQSHYYHTMSNYGLYISVLCTQVGTPTFIRISVQKKNTKYTHTRKKIYEERHEIMLIA